MQTCCVVEECNDGRVARCKVGLGCCKGEWTGGMLCRAVHVEVGTTKTEKAGNYVDWNRLDIDNFGCDGWGMGWLCRYGSEDRIASTVIGRGNI
jgi:hypothetical protein